MEDRPKLNENYVNIIQKDEKYGRNGKDINKDDENEQQNGDQIVEIHDETITPETVETQTSLHYHEVILKEIKTEEMSLTDLSINALCKIINEHKLANNFSFNIQDVLWHQHPEYYRTVPKGQKDIQILFHQNDADDSVNTHHELTGHWMTTFYDSDTNKLNIYYSLPKKNPNDLSLSNTQKTILEKLYPDLLGSDICFKTPMTQQSATDEHACGVFALAYAVTLALGYDPADYPFALRNEELGGSRTIYMREHLAIILDEGKLFPIPRPLM